MFRSHVACDGQVLQFSSSRNGVEAMCHVPRGEEVQSGGGRGWQTHIRRLVLLLHEALQTAWVHCAIEGERVGGAHSFVGEPFLHLLRSHSTHPAEVIHDFGFRVGLVIMLKIPLVHHLGQVKRQRSRTSVQVELSFLIAR